MSNDGDTGLKKPRQKGRRGLLAELSAQQEELRGLILDIREQDDKTLMDGIVGSYPNEDQLIAVAIVLNELAHDPDRNPDMSDIFWAIEFLDHLDTLGLKLVPK